MNRRRIAGFSAALCRGLIEATGSHADSIRAKLPFSAALCRGLIEAGAPGRGSPRRACGFPRLYAAASLKPRTVVRRLSPAQAVFRGFMPRPH